jgi:fumarate reductase subunit C
MRRSNIAPAIVYNVCNTFTTTHILWMSLMLNVGVLFFGKGLDEHVRDISFFSNAMTAANAVAPFAYLAVHKGFMSLEEDVTMPRTHDTRPASNTTGRQAVQAAHHRAWHGHSHSPCDRCCTRSDHRPRCEA